MTKDDLVLRADKLTGKWLCAYVVFWVIAAVVLVGLVGWGIMDPVDMRGVHVVR